MSRRVVWICLFACVVFSTSGQESAPFEAQTPRCETPGGSSLFSTSAQALTFQAVQRAAHQVRKSQPLLEKEWDAVMQFGDYLRANLGPDNLAYLEELLARARHLSTKAADVDFSLLALDSERAALESLDLEVADLARNLPDLPDGQPIPQKGWPVVLYWGTLAACDVGINACFSDVEEAWEDCESGILCGPEGLPLLVCCNEKAQHDLLNCAITCGANGPDGDYGTCCRPGPGG